VNNEKLKKKDLQARFTEWIDFHSQSSSNINIIIIKLQKWQGNHSFAQQQQQKKKRRLDSNSEAAVTLLGSLLEGGGKTHFNGGPHPESRIHNGSWILVTLRAIFWKKKKVTNCLFIYGLGGKALGHPTLVEITSLA
jgi:hypothetical protein